MQEEVLTRIDTSLADILNSSTLDHVPHSEALNSLVLSNTTGTVGTANKFNVATSFLVATTISSFLGLEKSKRLTHTMNRHPESGSGIRPISIAQQQNLGMNGHRTDI